MAPGRSVHCITSSEGPRPRPFPTRWRGYAMIQMIERILENESRLSARRWATFAAANTALLALIALMLV